MVATARRNCARGMADLTGPTDRSTGGRVRSRVVITDADLQSADVDRSRETSGLPLTDDVREPLESGPGTPADWDTAGPGEH